MASLAHNPNNLTSTFSGNDQLYFSILKKYFLISSHRVLKMCPQVEI